MSNNIIHVYLFILRTNTSDKFKKMSSSVRSVIKYRMVRANKPWKRSCTISSRPRAIDDSRIDKTGGERDSGEAAKILLRRVTIEMSPRGLGQGRIIRRPVNGLLDKHRDRKLVSTAHTPFNIRYAAELMRVDIFNLRISSNHRSKDSHGSKFLRSNSRIAHSR